MNKQKIAENKKELYNSFLTYTFGMLMMAIGGILGILDGWTFWYPLGILTMPWLSSLFGLCRKEEKQHNNTKT